MVDLSRIVMSKEVLQSLVFIAGYAVHAYLKSNSVCEACLTFLTEDKTIAIDESKFSLIQIIVDPSSGHLTLLLNPLFWFGNAFLS